MSGAQTGLNAFAPGRDPTIARATGISWMLGMGRFGSIVGSLVGGALLGLAELPRDPRHPRHTRIPRGRSNCFGPRRWR
jgi:hypothetical protein